MPWKEVSTMRLRHEFVVLAAQQAAGVQELCRRFGVSRKTAYKWLHRFRQHGLAGLEDQSRRPLQSPARTLPEIEEAVLALRRQHPAWGGRKLRAVLQAGGRAPLPAASTITEILRRAALLDPHTAAQHRAFVRFEHAAPNDLWQVDFKGHFALADGHRRCHPLTVLDDHSRFAIGLLACGNQTAATVQQCLTPLFERYGLPHRLLMDNGPPFGASGSAPYTELTVWLLRLGMRVTHGRPFHPQTQGKAERFHRTLKAEILAGNTFRELDDCQQAFDQWRDAYNLQRPHEALDLQVPASRYQPSPRTMPPALPAIEYGPDDQVRRAHRKGLVSFRGHPIRVGDAFYRQPIAFRPVEADGLFDVYFCQQRLGQVDLRQSPVVLQPHHRPD